ncbi:TetR/AcrR family transcriptional regulator [Phytomonospora endophytica]|uniref:AcrR family transcriptional regulator n=1 Tax=Phytomonospora endophytica TaxID=714109 RepID=A0A841FKV4_9ACTN|nr:TetR/AcrR family transcriptional regulator [Phytomonospora endophytica]MBB6034448.1 AcrR family transcriptional regulator [Phytomonospora endophytica]GIG66842.1 TetR family transcriptional regulator [Phytomonospora endophytica]
MAEDFTDALALLWGLKPPPTRGPKAALNPELITVAAIAVADEQGLPALTMQVVAERLSFTKMSLYRHVPGRAELVALMVDHAVGPAPELAPSAWRPRLTAWAEALWHVLLRHPWLLAAMVGRRPLGPNELAWTDHAVAALEDTGLDGGERLDTVFTVAGHVRGTAQQLVTPEGTRREGGEAELDRALAVLLDEHRERYPALTAALAVSTPDQALAFGLDRILDGVAGLIASRR